MSELPSGWDSLKTSKLFSARKGKKPRFLQPQESPGFVPYLDIHAVEKGNYRQYADIESSRIGTKEDIFIVWDGARSGWVALGKEGAIGSTLVALQTLWGKQEYIFYFLKSQFDYINSNTRGTGIPHVDPSIFDDIEIPLPPLNEQKRIVEKLEKLLGKVEAAEERLDKIPVILKRFRHSILAAACSGKLSADWRKSKESNDDTQSVRKAVLEFRRAFWENDQVAKLKAKGTKPKSSAWRLKYIQPSDEDSSSLPFLPENWDWINLGLVGANPLNTVQTGPFGSLLHNTEFEKSGVPVIAVGNLTGMGFSTKGLYFVSNKKAAELARFDVNAGDVLFARSGATLGKVCVAPPEVVNWRMTGHILRVRLNRDFLLPEFAIYCLHGSPPVVDQVTGNIRGATRPGFNTTLLETISLPIPPIEEQKEIVRRVEDLFRFADQIEERYKKARSYTDKLTQSILAKAFRGELVPQDPNDEPASALLERIQQEKEN